VALYVMGGALWYSMGSESSWFEIPTPVRAARLAWVIFAGAGAYFASLWLMGLRLRDFARHE
jgi:putative peptidoglycan lipid II flippase